MPSSRPVSLLLSSKLLDTKEHALSVLYLQQSLGREESAGFKGTKGTKTLDELEIEVDNSSETPPALAFHPMRQRAFHDTVS